jgi:hypothetical protein
VTSKQIDRARYIPSIHREAVVGGINTTSTKHHHRGTLELLVLSLYVKTLIDWVASMVIISVLSTLTVAAAVPSNLKMQATFTHNCFQYMATQMSKM